MPRTLGAGHLANNKMYEVQRTNHFEVQIPGLGEEVTLTVESFTMPAISNSPIELAHGNTRVKVAGQAAFEDTTMVVKDAIGADIEKKINDWQRQVYNPANDQIGWASEYKRNCLIYEYAPDGTFVRTWRLEGAWPSNVTYGDMNYDGSDKKLVTITLSYDKAYRI